ncbi:hypothetical protein PGTUg99_001064 [Puccinia graminis f. sp. tritici]|uniref:Uncharacterized protein n=1 Tax=Puccinia graminis f. sp. tritici TaxID=56615 RepID=A0A5B0RG48_PUCGR|nr:hypothetical protein PGTUg99_001064 [Puccinia graminis f. sp. tritici]
MEHSQAQEQKAHKSSQAKINHHHKAKAIKHINLKHPNSTFRPMLNHHLKQHYSINHSFPDPTLPSS